LTPIFTFKTSITQRQFEGSKNCLNVLYVDFYTLSDDASQFVVIFSVFGKFFASQLFVVIEHLWYYALNHRKSIPQGVATKRNNFGQWPTAYN
jgi:hypothetical protein